MNEAIRKALRAQRGEAAGECPDDNVLAAYLESRLPWREVGPVEQHAATCPACQEVLGLALRLDGAEEAGAPVERAVGQVAVRRFRFVLPVSVLGAALLALFAGILFLRTIQESTPRPAPVEMARLEAPKQEEAVAAGRISEPQAAPPRRRPEGPAPAASEAPVPAMPEQPAPVPAVESGMKKGLRPAREDQEKPSPEKEARDAVAMNRQVAEQPVSLPVAEGAQTVVTASTPPIGLAGAAGARSAEAKATSEADELREKVKDTPPAAAMRMSLADQQAGRERSELRGVLHDAARWAGEGAVRRVGELEFRQIAGYWIDSRCREFAGAEIVEMRTGSEGVAPILQEVGGLDALLEEKTPVVVHWQGRNYLIR